MIVPLSIGTIKIDLILENQQLKDVLEAQYSLFCRKDGDGLPVHVHWDRSSCEADQQEPQVVFSNEMIQVRSTGYEGSIQPERGAFLDISHRNPLVAIEYFLRVASAVLAFNRGGLMFHGAGILHHGKGYIFFGHSGSGKTTVSKLSPADIVLNDDLLILVPFDGGWLAHATPFWNPSQVKPNNQTMCITGMYRLVKDQTAFVEVMSPAQVVGELVANTPVIPADIRNLPLVLARCRQISKDIPVRWLHFSRDDSFWMAIDN